MKKLALIALVALTASAQSTMPRDEKIDLVAQDLHALGRVATVAKDLPESRQILLSIVDSDVDMLRIPRPDGTYQWASLQREEASRVTDEKTIEQVHTEAELRNVTISAPNAYRVVISVPQKRGVLAQNNRVWVRNVLVDSTGFDGKLTHTELPVNAWVNPGDANTVALPDIGKSVKATAELGVESGSKKAVAEVALVQAKLIDDPNSPYFPAVKRLLQVREHITAKEMNRGHLKTSIDEALLALPGELEKRAAEQARLVEQRRQAALGGTMKHAITLGDATPDVVHELSEIARLMNGTLQEQSDARMRLDQLIVTLRPPTPRP
ncbi:MAG TPA: hypothetical protein VGF48_22940 [Thermoanaerobaculia bacterium]|jgi:hypothetical protein